MGVKGNVLKIYVNQQKESFDWEIVEDDRRDEIVQTIKHELAKSAAAEPPSNGGSRKRKANLRQRLSQASGDTPSGKKQKMGPNTDEDVVQTKSLSDTFTM